VTAGQLVGHVGDSGGGRATAIYAEYTRAATAVDPSDAQAAQQLLFSVVDGTTFTLQLTGTTAERPDREERDGRDDSAAGGRTA
jgi:hypothetical protein